MPDPDADFAHDVVSARSRGPLRDVYQTCVPAALTSAISLLSAVVVTGLVGHMDGTALYVRSIYLPLSLVLTAVTVAFAVPVQVAVARSRGDGGPLDQSARIGSAARLVVVALLLLAMLTVIAAGPMGRLASMPAELVPSLRQFALLMLAAQVLGTLGELGAATLRGLGRAALGTAMSLTAAAVNVTLVAVLGLARGGGLDAVPVSSAVAGAVEIGLGLLLLTHLGVVRVPHLLRWDPRIVATTLRIGPPIAVSFLVLFVNSILLLHIVSMYGGRSAVEGFSTALSVQDFVTIPAVGFGSGIAVLVNARTGDRASVLRAAFTVLVVAYLALTLVLVIGSSTLVHLMLPRGGAADQAVHYLHVVGPSLGLTGLTIAALTVMEEVGLGAWSVAINLVFLVTVVAVGWVSAARTGSVDGLYTTILVAGLAAGVTVPILAYRKVTGLVLP